MRRCARSGRGRPRSKESSSHATFCGAFWIDLLRGGEKASSATWICPRNSLSGFWEADENLACNGRIDRVRRSARPRLGLGSHLQERATGGFGSLCSHEESPLLRQFFDRRRVCYGCPLGTTPGSDRALG